MSQHDEINEDDIEPFLPHFNLTNKDRIDCGSHGCVYRLPSNGTVIKFTADLSEARMSMLLLGKAAPDKPSFLPLIYGIYRFPLNDISTGLYAINREDLVDVKPGSWMTHHSEWENIMNSAHYHWLVGLKGSSKTPSGLLDPDYFKKWTEEFVAQYKPEDQQQIRDLISVEAWCKKTGVSLTDNIIDNFGVRPTTGELVIRDFGMVKLSPHVLSLWGIKH